jgi:hypothetical protein
VRRRSLGAALAALLVAAGLASCGVPLESQAQPLPSGALPPERSTASPTPTGVPAESPSPEPEPTGPRLRLWFVQDGGLLAAESDLPAGTPAGAVVDALVVGPPPDAPGLRTIAVDPLTGQPLVTIAPDTPGEPDPAGTVTVRLGSAFSSLPSTEQVLLLGQVVLSLTGSGWGAVTFTDEAGTPVAVPLPDGLLLDTPALARDYAVLIIRP